MTKIAGSGSESGSISQRHRSESGSISQRHGSADPDPYQNVRDPQHWFEGTMSKVSWVDDCVKSSGRGYITTLHDFKCWVFRAGSEGIQNNLGNSQGSRYELNCKSWANYQCLNNIIHAQGSSTRHTKVGTVLYIQEYGKTPSLAKDLNFRHLFSYDIFTGIKVADINSCLCFSLPR